MIEIITVYSYLDQTCKSITDVCSTIDNIFYDYESYTHVDLTKWRQIKKPEQEDIDLKKLLKDYITR